MAALSSPSVSWAIFDRLTETQYQPFKQAGIEYFIAQLLYNRGITIPDATRAFLDARYDQTPEPQSLIDMDKALIRILRALNDREHITIYGDFDADGVTSAALLTRALRRLKYPDAILDYHIGSRFHDIRGLSKEVIDRLAKNGTSLIITTDCGSSDVEEVEYARRLGIDVIITDHHHPPEPRPDAYAMINPWRADCTYSERYLCGAGIAFKVVQALYRAHNQPVEEELALLDLVAIGTLGDVAQLLGENHTLVRMGMQQLNKTRNPGLRALIRLVNLQPGKIRERDIAYVLGPRINAAGRMKDAGIAFELLTTDDEDEARRRAMELEELNVLRQRQTEELMASVRKEVQRYADDPVILVSGDNWPEGIIGLVAGRLSEEIQRTVLVISKGRQSSRGSGRSYGKFNLILALRERADLFERYGGHSQAAGFTIANDRIEELREHLLDWQARGTVSTAAIETADLTDVVLEQESFLAERTPKVDLVLKKPEYLNYSTYSKMRQLSPFGAGNPEPVFKIEGMRLKRRWLSGPEGRHLRMQLQVRGVQFNGTFLRGGSQLQSLNEGALVNVIFHLDAAWTAPESESRPEIRLTILQVEPAG